MQTRIQLNQSQMRCLTSPPRYDVYNALRMLGKGTANEIGKILGKGPKSLHYHLRDLERNGLIRVDERRQIGKTVEVVYATQGRFLEFDPARDLQDVAVYMASVLRQSEREVGSAASMPMADATRTAYTHLFRTTVRLKPADMARFEEMIHKALDFARARTDTSAGPATSVTIAVVPVDAP